MDMTSVTTALADGPAAIAVVGAALLLIPVARASWNAVRGFIK